MFQCYATISAKIFHPSLLKQAVAGASALFLYFVCAMWSIYSLLNGFRVQNVAAPCAMRYHAFYTPSKSLIIAFSECGDAGDRVPRVGKMLFVSSEAMVDVPSG